MKVYITLYDQTGSAQSAGTVTITAEDGEGKLWSGENVSTTHLRVSMGEWVMGGEHVRRSPLGLIRRIARNWAEDGGDRPYQGRDETTGTTFAVHPAD